MDGLDQHRGGAGEPLVLVHGIGHTWRGWKPMLPLLEPRFDVLAIDLPGFGRSPALPPGVESTPETLADSVEGAMDAAGFERAHVAGNSLGGWIGLELGRRGRALTVTAISPAGLAWGREGAWGAAVLRAMRWVTRNAPVPAAVLRNVAGRTLLAGPQLGRPWRADPDDLIEQTPMFAQAEGFEATLPNVLGRQVRGLDEIRCPVEFEFQPPPDFVEAGFFEPYYRGAAGFREYVSAWSEVFGSDLRVEPVELIDMSDRVVLLAELPARAQASGVPFTGKIATVSVLEHGKAIRVQTYLDHAEALEAAGLPG